MSQEIMNKTSLNLHDTLVKIRNLAITIAEQEWLELGSLIDHILPSPINPFFILPIATGISGKGQISELIHAAAIVVLIDVSLRIVDDCADQDNLASIDRSIGVGRSINYAMALNTLATRELLNCATSNQNLEPLINYYFHLFLQVCEGQDRDIFEVVNSLKDYQQLIKLKTLPAYQFATVIGAYIGFSDQNSIAVCYGCGSHLGWMAQILDDIESLWFPVTENIQEAKKKTFPVLLGLTLDHPNAKTLADWLDKREYNRIEVCQLLDEMDVRTRLTNIALDHRDEAIKSLASLPNLEGSIILKFWLDWYLQNGERLLKPIGL